MNRPSAEIAAIAQAILNAKTRNTGYTVSALQLFELAKRVSELEKAQEKASEQL